MEIIKISIKSIIIGIIFISFGLLLKYCDTKKLKNITDTNLTNQEQSVIILNPNTGSVTTVRRNRKNKKATTVVTKPINGSRDVRIGISPDGWAIVTARTYGFIFEPGFVAGYSAPKIRFGTDAQIYFHSYWGVNVGLTTTTNFNIKPFVGASYTLGVLELNNTSVLLGIDSQRKMLIALRVHL